MTNRRFAIYMAIIVVVGAILIVLAARLDLPWEKQEQSPEDCHGQVIVDIYGDYWGCLQG